MLVCSGDDKCGLLNGVLWGPGTTAGYALNQIMVGDARLLCLADWHTDVQVCPANWQRGHQQTSYSHRSGRLMPNTPQLLSQLCALYVLIAVTPLHTTAACSPL